MNRILPFVTCLWLALLPARAEDPCAADVQRLCSETTVGKGAVRACLVKNEAALGEACRAFLRTYGVVTDHTVWGGERLGIYFLESGAAQRASKVVYDRAGSSIAAVKPGMG